MKIFAIELSSKFGSAAVVESGRVVVEQRWEENFKSRQQLFDAIEAMMIDWASVDAFVAGRGPGAFSGMRISFSVVNALAAPAGQPVYALSSGAALAERYGSEKTVVVGDARRNKVWAGCFSGNTLEKPFELMEYDQLAAFVPEGALVLSPDHDRIEALLQPFNTLEPNAPVFPDAGTLGVLAEARLTAGETLETFEPLYMHPPVFIKPRFTA